MWLMRRLCGLIRPVRLVCCVSLTPDRFGLIRRIRRRGGARRCPGSRADEYPKNGRSIQSLFLSGAVRAAGLGGAARGADRAAPAKSGLGAAVSGRPGRRVASGTVAPVVRSAAIRNKLYW